MRIHSAIRRGYVLFPNAGQPHEYLIISNQLDPGLDDRPLWNEILSDIALSLHRELLYYLFYLHPFFSFQKTHLTCYEAYFAQAQSTTTNCTSTLIFIICCRRFRRESGVRSCLRFVFISDFWSLSLYGKSHFLSILFMYFYKIFFSFSSLNICYTVFSSYILMDGCRPDPHAARVMLHTFRADQVVIKSTSSITLRYPYGR